MKAQRQIGRTSWFGYCVCGLLTLVVVLPFAWIVCYMPSTEEHDKAESEEVDLVDLASGTANEKMLEAQNNIFSWIKMRKPELLFMPDAVLGFTLGVVERNYAPDMTKDFQHRFLLRCEDMKITPYHGYVCQVPERSIPGVFPAPELSSLPSLERTWNVDFQSVEQTWTVPAKPRQDGIVWRDARGQTWQKAPRLSSVSEALRNKVQCVTRLEVISQGAGFPRRVVVRESCGMGELDRQAVQALLQSKPEETTGMGSTGVCIFWNSRCVRTSDKWSY